MQKLSPLYPSPPLPNPCSNHPLLSQSLTWNTIASYFLCLLPLVAVNPLLYVLHYSLSRVFLLPSSGLGNDAGCSCIEVIAWYRNHKQAWQVPVVTENLAKHPFQNKNKTYHFQNSLVDIWMNRTTGPSAVAHWWWQSTVIHLRTGGANGKVCKPPVNFDPCASLRCQRCCLRTNGFWITIKIR